MIICYDQFVLINYKSSIIICFYKTPHGHFPPFLIKSEKKSQVYTLMKLIMQYFGFLSETSNLDVTACYDMLTTTKDY